MIIRYQLHCWLLLTICLLMTASQTNSQTKRKSNSSCSIGKTYIECPKYFKKLPDVDQNIRFLKYKDEGLEMYFFITLASSGFDDTKLKEAVSKLYAGEKATSFRWKEEDDPLIMNMKTKYKPRVLASLGLSGEYLLEFKAFVFDVKDKKAIFGYVSNEGENEKVNEILFNKGNSLGDMAAGCNAVVSTLNSITKEFKEKEQYCFLTGFTTK